MSSKWVVKADTTLCQKTEFLKYLGNSKFILTQQNDSDPTVDNTVCNIVCCGPKLVLSVLTHS